MLLAGVSQKGGWRLNQVLDQKQRKRFDARRQCFGPITIEADKRKFGILPPIPQAEPLIRIVGQRICAKFA